MEQPSRDPKGSDKLARTRLKQHEYHARFTDDEYHQLSVMAKHGRKMSNVISRGIQCEWKYFQALTELAKYKQNNAGSMTIDEFKMRHFEQNPELLDKYVKTATIQKHTAAIQQHNQQLEASIAAQETVAYLIRKIGNNINQLAKVANAGGNVPRDELRKLTQAIIKLDNHNRQLTGEK